jgi:hypothetical protein
MLSLAGTASAELVVHLKLDDATGTIASDASGNGHDGTLTGNPQWATGYFDGALRFDGGDTVTLPGQDMGMNSQEGSVAFWMNAAPPSGINTMFWAGDNTTGTGFGTENEIHVHLESAVAGIWQGGELSFYIPGAHIHSDPQKGAAGNAPIDPVLMGDNEWHHVVATWSSSNGSIALYLDGEPLSSAAYSNSGFPLTYVYLGQMAAGNRTYSGLLDDVQIYSEALTDQGVQLAMAGGKAAGPASQPSPPNAAKDVRQDIVLSWAPGPYAATHDVYFGTSFDDVNAADRANPLGVLASPGQVAETFEPDEVLAFGQTYYWRVDEVNAAPDNTTFRGEVWSFTTERYTSQIENIVATASTTSNNTSTPARTVDGSGLIDGAHSTNEAEMWMGVAAEGDPVWIQYDFDRIYKLHDMRVWNYNMQYESVVGLGLKDVTIEYAAVADEWVTWADIELPRATSLATYAGTTIDLGGIAARAIRFTIHNNRSAYQPLNFGLSEVQFNYIPVVAREPQPADGATDASVETVLSWRPGREATLHQVYLGDDEAAVAGSAVAYAVGESRFAPGPLDLGTTYYWKVDEVNEAATPAVWQGDVWSFSTPPYLVIDDFESYNDKNNLIYDAWLDGYEVAANGSIVGYENPPYAEQTLVFSGKQAMPFHYGTQGATTSEAELSLGEAQDWTQGGAKMLVVFFRGALGNAPGQLYLKVNNTKVDFPGGTAALAAPVWKQWNVDLATLGNTAKSVTKLTIGVSGSGTGLIYLDDIRLYRSTAPMVGPAVDPGAANLVALYAMEDNANDGSGNNRHGTAEVGSSFASGLTGYGKAVVLDGTSGYVTLPIGTLVQSLTSATFATWVNYGGAGGAWQRVFDFGSDTNAYLFFTQRNGSGVMRFSITTTSSAGESVLNGPSALPTGWHHVAVTIDGASREMGLYFDGRLVDSGPTGTLPTDLGNTTQNWIGRSQYTADAYFNGSVDDFRIYNRALSEAEVRYLVGDR